MQHLLNQTHPFYVITEAFASLLFETQEESYKGFSHYMASCHLSLLFQLAKQYSCCSVLISGEFCEDSVTVCQVLRTYNSFIISPKWLILGCFALSELGLYGSLSTVLLLFRLCALNAPAQLSKVINCYKGLSAKHRHSSSLWQDHIKTI